jgi:hypothetical protein
MILGLISEEMVAQMQVPMKEQQEAYYETHIVMLLPCLQA